MKMQINTFLLFKHPTSIHSYSTQSLDQFGFSMPFLQIQEMVSRMIFLAIGLASEAILLSRMLLQGLEIK